MSAAPPLLLDSPAPLATATATRRGAILLGTLGLTGLASATLTAPSAEAVAISDVTLRRGSRGKAVQRLQLALNAIQGPHLTIDGVFGAKAEKRLRTFQRTARLTVDGRTGARTRAALTKALRSHPAPTLHSPLHIALRVSSEFNRKRRNPVTHTILAHEGIDLRAASGTRVYAAAAGTVVHVGWDPEDHSKSGNQITIDHGHGYLTRYSHLKKQAWKVRKGQKVKSGQFLALSGSTGRSTGPHLHYGVMRAGRFINPRTMYHF